jgi:hypothetical protein
MLTSGFLPQQAQLLLLLLLLLLAASLLAAAPLLLLLLLLQPFNARSLSSCKPPASALQDTRKVTRADQGLEQQCMLNYEVRAFNDRSGS